MRERGDRVKGKEKEEKNRLIRKDTEKKLSRMTVHVVVLNCISDGKKSGLLVLLDISAVRVAELT